MESKALTLKKCCVLGCKDRRSIRHRFPKRDKNMFEKWLNIVNPPDWKNLTCEQIYNRYFVCDSHFDRKYSLPGSKRGLTVDAIPNIGITGMIQPYIDVPCGILENAGSSSAVAVCENYIEYVDDAGNNISIESIPGLVPGPSTSMSAMETNWENERKIAEVVTKGPSTSMFAAMETNWEEERNITEVEPKGPSISMSSAMETNCEAKKKVAQVVTGKRRLILKNINVSRSSHLTPRERILYYSLKKSMVNLSVTQKKLKSFKQRLAMAEKLGRGKSFQGLLKNMNAATYNFVMCQVRNQNKKSYGRRYTLEEKVLALALYKASPKGYRLLCKLFTLPASKTLTRLLNRLPFHPGINDHIFQQLKKTTVRMKMQEKHCALIFDEISLEANLTFEKGYDEIVGLEDYGNEKKALIASYANVFMLKGVYRQWKQPVAFTFSKGPIKAIHLKVLIKDIILKCQEIGLQVITTICDQGSGNQAAINMLLEEKRQYCLQNNIRDKYFGFLVGNQEIVPLYDIPHLFKGLRNNLLTKSLKFLQDGVVKIARWNHIEQFYQLDSSEPSLRICSKLTDGHVIPRKINKMKVKMCTQIFSHSVGSLMKRISQWDIKDRFNLPKEAADTADLILFLDQLFDSLNISRKSKPQAKPLKCAVTSKSPHNEFWYSALDVLNSMYFHCPIKGKDVNVPTVKNLKFTLRGIMYIVDRLLIEKQFKYVLTGAFNQDCLENFFSYIRSHNVRCSNPNVSNFIHSFKALTLNNFFSVHSSNSNCQEDATNECIDNLRSFLTGEFVADIHQLADIGADIPKNVVLQKRIKLARCTVAYMSGAICKILLKNNSIKNCHICQQNLFSHSISEDIDYIEARKYERGNLLKAGQYANFIFTHSFNYLFYLIPRLSNCRKISKVLKNILKSNLNFGIFDNCTEHNLGERFCEVVVKCCIFWWCSQVNKILNGSDTKFKSFALRNTNKDLIDPIKSQALEIFEKKKSQRCNR